MDPASKPPVPEVAIELSEATDEDILREMIEWFRGVKACSGAHGSPPVGKVSAPGSQNTQN